MATAAVLSVVLFGVLRVPFVQTYLLLPFTRAQHGLACRIGGDPNASISVGLSCSAADVIALCLGFILAFPVAWRRRVTGAACGLLLIAAVNTVRLATLSHAIRNRQWFDLLHVYIWPGVLLVVVSLYVFWWMSRALKTPGDRPSRSPTLAWLPLPRQGVRFAGWTILFVVLFVGSSGWWMDSDSVLHVADWIAASGAVIIKLCGGEATVSNNLLRTGNGSWIVTQECIMTPLMPAYFAAVLSLRMGWLPRVVALLAAGPLFFALGTARLLVLALPTRWVGSHVTAIHAFYQLLLAVLLVAAVTYWSERQPRSWGRMSRRFLLASLVGAVIGLAVGLTYNRAAMGAVETLHALLGHGGHDWLDPQGALLLMVPYQTALLAALLLAWQPPPTRRGVLLGFAFLLAAQPLLLVLLGEWVAHTGWEPPVAALRAASIGTVLGLAALLRAPRLGGAASRSALPAVESAHG